MHKLPADISRLSEPCLKENTRLAAQLKTQSSNLFFRDLGIAIDLLQIGEMSALRFRSFALASLK